MMHFFVFITGLVAGKICPLEPGDARLAALAAVGAGATGEPHDGNRGLRWTTNGSALIGTG